MKYNNTTNPTENLFTHLGRKAEKHTRFFICNVRINLAYF